MNLRISIIAQLFAFCILFGLINQGCIRDKCNMTYSYLEYSPVYMSPTEFRSSVRVEAPRELQDPGKILIHGDYLFVNEVAKGVHLIDNRDPSNPVPTAFISAPGTYDLAINCDLLYLDSSTDLLVFDLNDPANPNLIERVENALPHIIYYRGFQADPEKGVVIEWISEMKEAEYSCEEGDLPDFMRMNRVMDPTFNTNINTINNANTAGRGVNPAIPGKAGSMSRFAVNGNIMYIITPTELRVYDVSSCPQPSFSHSVEINTWGGEAETIFLYGDLILLGATNGMFIYDGSNPSNPTMISRFDHMSGCDPVVAENDIAYVTLRSSQQTNCPGWTNQLDVIDISDPWAPVLLRTYPMAGPQGLGIENGTLFLCDGDAGLKIYDATDPNGLESNLLSHMPEMDAYDAIPNNGVLMMIGKDGLAQYDYSDPRNISPLSIIPVVQ